MKEIKLNDKLVWKAQNGTFLKNKGVYTVSAVIHAGTFTQVTLTNKKGKIVADNGTQLWWNISADECGFALVKDTESEL